MNSWAREMISLVKCLACECADLSSVPQEAPKPVYAPEVGVRQAETGDSLGLGGYPA